MQKPLGIILQVCSFAFLNSLNIGLTFINFTTHTGRLHFNFLLLSQCGLVKLRGLDFIFTFFLSKQQQINNKYLKIWLKNFHLLLTNQAQITQIRLPIYIDKIRDIYCLKSQMLFLLCFLIIGASNLGVASISVKRKRNTKRTDRYP